MKKFLIVGLLVAVCLSMLACNAAKDTAPATEAPTEAPTQAPTEAPTEAAATEPSESEPFDWSAIINQNTGPGCAGNSGGSDE